MLHATTKHHISQVTIDFLPTDCLSFAILFVIVKKNNFVKKKLKEKFTKAKTVIIAVIWVVVLLLLIAVIVPIAIYFGSNKDNRNSHIIDSNDLTHLNPGKVYSHNIEGEKNSHSHAITDLNSTKDKIDDEDNSDSHVNSSDLIDLSPTKFEVLADLPHPINEIDLFEIWLSENSTKHDKKEEQYLCLRAIFDIHDTQCIKLSKTQIVQLCPITNIIAPFQCELSLKINNLTSIDIIVKVTKRMEFTNPKYFLEILPPHGIPFCFFFLTFLTFHYIKFFVKYTTNRKMIGVKQKTNFVYKQITRTSRSMQPKKVF